MFMAFVVLFFTVAISLGLMAVVAVSSGRFTPRKEKWAEVADKANEYLNAQGETPRFLESLDAVRVQPGSVVPREIQGRGLVRALDTLRAQRRSVSAE
ncbi:hypothetical protein [Tessaracoccus caeni]|uniref:hypothetical protein n=1 Tax=Tessaracoccus caeni TaxID=3031239 RepID=UPI0023DC0177|nr:hypothetical protein [Tessaracoccus caeni]MDF1489783.1 hypothetical protein [Tessaracoccus caeni]